MRPIRPRKFYVLVAIEAGADMVDANRMMRVVAERLSDPSIRLHMTTTEVLPKALQPDPKPPKALQANPKGGA